MLTSSWISWVPIGIVGLTSWLVWLVRRTLSHRYRPTLNDHRETVSVVVPVYREDPDVLERCLRTWISQQPFEVILVVDDRDAQVLDRLRILDLAGVCVLPWRHTGKRGALGAGIRTARGDIIVLADSDTSWQPGLLDAIQMPFADPHVGGVGTRQFVYARESNLMRRIAHWLLNTRYLDYVPAMSRTGSVPCLSGRTAAYRGDVIRPRLPLLEHEIFLGRECVSGDDGRLTWLVLAAGYRTVHQDSARAESMFPDSLAAFVKQRVRWSRNSYRCYLTAIGHGLALAAAPDHPGDRAPDPADSVHHGVSGLVRQPSGCAAEGRWGFSWCWCGPAPRGQFVGSPTFANTRLTCCSPR